MRQIVSSDKAKKSFFFLFFPFLDLRVRFKEAEEANPRAMMSPMKEQRHFTFPSDVDRLIEVRYYRGTRFRK